MLLLGALEESFFRRLSSMKFTCQYPYILFAILLLIPALIICIIHYKRLMNQFSVYLLKDKESVFAKRISKLPAVLVFRCIFRSLAWICLILACAGFSWGTYLEPVQKNGNAVSMVFDISYSMNADDAPEGLTRLRAASKYASMLLSHMENTSVSVVVAKGDGVVVVPLTEDTSSLETLFDTITPALMSSVGSSVGKGIRSALKSFPENSSMANRIWVFTDGDETDGLMENAISDCLKTGVSVSLIGFGTERETKVLAGDGKTYVPTALRSEKMKKICESATKKNFIQTNTEVFAEYIDATEPGSAVNLLEPLKKHSSSDNGADSLISYEVRPVQRYALFMGLGLFFFILGFIVTEFDINNISRIIHKGGVVSAIFCAFMFTSCGTSVKDSATVLQGTWNWYQQKYNKSIAGFLQTACNAQKNEDEILEQYALYDLAVTYLSKSENDAALVRLAQISKEAPEPVLYATFYNMGIIAFRAGDYENAASYFKNALKVDGSKINAKINLELSLINSEKEQKAKSNIVKEVSKEESKDSMERAIFHRIREIDKKQWKNSENKENQSSAQDF